ATFFTKKLRLTSTASRSGPFTSEYEAATMCVEGEQGEMSDVLPGTSPQTARPASSQYGLDLLFKAPAEERGVLQHRREGVSRQKLTSRLNSPLRRPSLSREIGLEWVPPPLPTFAILVLGVAQQV
ncbi:hypothetical protein M9458_010243, partial [Cirrhinus mrigala]